ncbi:MAG: 2-oxoacid:acceptor oxidoreductase subunit alpha [Candidatus Aminicenantales bacterium]
MINDLAVMIAGKAGDGVRFTGNILAKILKKQGWEVVTTRDFPSNIRGEPTNYSIRASLDRIYGRPDVIDILLAFDCEAILRHLPEVADGGSVICDGQGIKNEEAAKRGITFHKLPIKELARTNFGSEIFKNAIALGVLCYLLDLEISVVEGIIKKIFLERKGEEIVQKNLEAVKFGCQQAEKTVEEKERHFLLKREDKGRLLISGNEAIALGALAAGCRFFAAYPICPATEIWEWLGKVLPEFNGLVVQTEDELAAINMALGASFAGARAMTSTSGPGASLMMEGFSLAGMTETPIVIAHIQRVGPSTGLPTKSEQADLNQWLYGGHGDFPRIILSPGTIEECFDFTIKAFNLAEKYQVPVIILSEEDYGQNYRTVERFDLSKLIIERGKLLSQEELLKIKEYKRYELTADGISPRALPSMKNGLHLVESNEHNEKGYRDESPDIRVKMMEKRMKKLAELGRDLPLPRLWGSKEAEIGLIGFGSTFGSIKEAMDRFQQQNIRTKYLQLRMLWPFPKTIVENFIKNSEYVFVVENNYSGQLNFLIRSQAINSQKIRSILKYSSQAFRPAEIVAEMKKVIE